MRNPTGTPASPLSISETHTSIRDFIHEVIDVAAAHGVLVGYRQVSRIYHRWRTEDAEQWDNPRLGQDKTMAQDPTGETAIRHIMAQLTRGDAA